MPRKHTCTVSMDSIKHRCDVVSDEHHGPAATGGGCMTWKTCATCGAWLPLGASNDEPEAVKVEMRAAELAAAWTPDGALVEIINAGEIRGWDGWPYRQPKNEDEHTGFLAAQIRNHERDAIGVNWAGHHMADHPINKETP